MSKSIIIRKQLLFCSVHTEFVPVVLVMCGCECTVYVCMYFTSFLSLQPSLREGLTQLALLQTTT